LRLDGLFRQHFMTIRSPGKVRRVFQLAVICQVGFALGPAPAQEKPARPDPDAVVVDDRTETVIKGALKYLASKQLANGAWGSADEERRHPVAMTGYVLLGFLAAGQVPQEGEQGKTVAAGMQYLLDSIQPDGLIGNRNDGQYMYGHGVASIALAELYGQTKSQSIRAKLERVIKVILSSQNREGGWRYRPVVSDADISVTVLQVVALRAAKNAGVDVPQQTINNAVQYVRSCYDERTGGFTYQPGNRAPGYARTAAAIYSLQVCGVYDDPVIKNGAEYLFKNRLERDWFTYGNFYAAPAMYMIGGESWQKYYSQTSDLLLKQVQRQGETAFWEPRIDQGRGGIGTIYATAVYTMILAMPYHYLPLYQR
jgi:hypothetical protein